MGIYKMINIITPLYAGIKTIYFIFKPLSNSALYLKLMMQRRASALPSCLSISFAKANKIFKQPD